MSGNAVTAIQGGRLQLVIDQQQYLQGYFGVLQICLTKKFGFSGLQFNTGAGFVDKSNVATLAPLIKQKSAKPERSYLADAFVSLID